jgi:uncharacterized protein (TIGR04255 family)
MPLNFPAVEDVHLENAPVREVICQVRFPTILRITREEPVEFQERIRKRFPVLEAERQVVIETEGMKPGGRAKFPPTVFRFHNRNRTQSVSLAPDFYALSVTDYKHWTDFSACLDHIARAAQEVYTIPYATRIGLRYINVLGPTFAGANEFSEVLDLLRDELTVMLKTDVILSPKLAHHRIEMLADSNQFTFRYGMIREGTPPEPRFLLDFDHYAEGELDLDDLLSRCERYHRHIYNAFRWCIAENKLSFFQPASMPQKGV